MADVGKEDNVERSAVEIQQECYEAMGDADWERYEKKDRPLLLQKIAIASCGPPTKEGNLTDFYKQGDQPTKLQGYDKRSEEIAMKVFNKICEQAKHSHNGENIYISIIRVVCVNPAKDVPVFKKEPKDYWINLHEKKGKEEVLISIFHVFSIRKCISVQDGVKGCRTFIDHDARVYKDWKSYLRENKLPKAVMVVPTNGEYKGFIKNEMPVVMLTVVPSPALGIGAKVLAIADTTNTVVGVGALVGCLGLLAAPVAVPMAVGGLVTVGAITSVYGIIRSSIHLDDRRKHEQSISLIDSESRGSWINILVSSAGISFAAAGRLLTWAAATGFNVRVLINAVQFLNYTTLASGLVGVTNSLGEMIHKYKKYDEKPTKLELFQFTSSLLFFGIGVMSTNTAQKIVEDAQAKSINNVRETLSSKAKRKMFDKVTAETRRIHGTVKGNTEIIKGLQVINDKNEFFAKLSKMNKQFNQNKLRISLSSDGGAMFNNRIKMTVFQLTELGKVGRDKLFATVGPADLTTKNVSTKIYTVGPGASTAQFASVEKTNEPFYIRPEEIIKIAAFINKLSKIDMEKICEMLSDVSSNVHQAFMLLCAEIFDAFLPELFSCLGPDWKIRVIKFVLNYLRNKIGDDCDNDDLKSVLKQFFLNGRIKPESFNMLIERIKKALFEEKIKQSASFDSRKYDGVYGFGEDLRKRYIELQAGKPLKVGRHQIILKDATIEKLAEEILVGYSQEKCDLFFDICTKVLETMTKEEVDRLSLMNPDEDVFMRIAKFLRKWGQSLLNEFSKIESINISVIYELRDDAIFWNDIQLTRKPETCAVCNGIRYIAK